MVYFECVRRGYDITIDQFVPIVSTASIGLTPAILWRRFGTLAISFTSCCQTQILRDASSSLPYIGNGWFRSQSKEAFRRQFVCIAFPKSLALRKHNYVCMQTYRFTISVILMILYMHDFVCAETPLLRRVPPAYSDGVYEPSGKNRPNPFDISQSVFNGTSGHPSYRNRTALLVFFGECSSKILLMHFLCRLPYTIVAS